ncbi:MAG TPA: glycosyl hydrolase family 18 protein [Bacteroidota bacterium]|nr:glycosyl hydrolase family 18 protein [Bacteroidota bacterium]
MRRRHAMITAFLVSVLISVSAIRLEAQRQPMWITAYYPWWYYNQMPVSEIDFSLMTHVVLFSANPVRQAPYLDVLVTRRDSANLVNGVDCGRPGEFLKELVSAAHQKGVKVILSVGGIWGPGADNMRFIAQDDRRIDVFVTAACAFARRWKIDGIELDWEFPQFADKWRHNQLIRRFRKELDQSSPRGIFIAATNESPLPAYDRKTMVEVFDQINPMTYELYRGDYSKNLTGYNGPVFSSTQFTPYIGTSIDQVGHGPKSWLDQGYPASKIGVSISFTTTVFTNVTPPVEPSRPYGEHNWGTVRDIPKRGRHWDHSSQVPWFGDGTTFISYEDTSSCRLKVEYARSLGLGGVMVYELGAGYLPAEKPGARNQLMQSVAAAVCTRARALGDLRPRTQDTEKPRARVTFPKEKATINGVISLKAEAQDNRGIVGLRFLIDGVPYGPVCEESPAVSAPLNTWRLTNGTHLIRIEAWDEANNIGASQITVTVSNRGKGPSFDDLVVFDEELRAPFIDASWGVVNNFKSTERFKSGSRSIKVEYGDHGALWLQHGTWGEETPILATEYKELSFDAYPSESFLLEIVFSNNTSQKVRLTADQWNAITVPISGAEPFTKFFLRRDMPGHACVYYDNIRLRSVQPFAQRSKH